MSSFRERNLFFGSTQFHWSSVARDLSAAKISVTADYHDSVPNASNYPSHKGYHPLEEVKDDKLTQDIQLTSAAIARTTVEANSSALLVFPAPVHCEPHEEISWAEFQYVVDDYGDIYFEIPDDRNILLDREVGNPVNAFFGMDIPLYGNRRVACEYDIFNIDNGDDILFDDDYFAVMDSEVSDDPVDWGMPDTSSGIHPIYFAKCLTKAINMENDRKMDHPSNGVSIVGYLSPAFADEESYLRRLFHCEDDFNSYWTDGENLNFSSESDGSNRSSTFHRLEIMRVELFSVYGVQSSISFQDFRDAKPDFLVHSNLAILEHFNGCNSALKALCKKKGIHVEGAKLIGVDSLGIDVRIFSGVEVRTHRFPFKVRATSEEAAEKQINKLLFPRSQRKKVRSEMDRIRNSK